MAAHDAGARGSGAGPRRVQTVWGRSRDHHTSATAGRHLRRGRPDPRRGAAGRPTASSGSRTPLTDPDVRPLFEPAARATGSGSACCPTRSGRGPGTRSSSAATACSTWSTARSTPARSRGPKPRPQAFEAAMEAVGVDDPARLRLRRRPALRRHLGRAQRRHAHHPRAAQRHPAASRSVTPRASPTRWSHRSPRCYDVVAALALSRQRPATAGRPGRDWPGRPAPSQSSPRTAVSHQRARPPTGGPPRDVLPPGVRRRPPAQRCSGPAPAAARRHGARRVGSRVARSGAATGVPRPRTMAVSGRADRRCTAYAAASRAARPGAGGRRPGRRGRRTRRPRRARRPARSAAPRAGSRAVRASLSQSHVLLRGRRAEAGQQPGPAGHWPPPRPGRGDPRPARPRRPPGRRQPAGVRDGTRAEPRPDGEGGRAPDATSADVLLEDDAAGPRRPGTAARRGHPCTRLVPVRTSVRPGCRRRVARSRLQQPLLGGEGGENQRRVRVGAGGAAHGHR